MRVAYTVDMSQAAFFAEHAKKRAADAVKAVEAQTAAEVVVAVRRLSGSYRAADYHAGFGAMAVVVGYMLVAPQIFTLGQMALDGLAAFVIGALLSANVSHVRRLLVRRRTLDANVDAAARAAFYDLGISRTSGRNGILVFLSAFERRCTVVPDIGVDPKSLGEDYDEACRAIADAARTMDLEAFLAAVEKLGPPLATAMPRRADDVNELPDEVC
jgi:putative membrane protein